MVDNEDCRLFDTPDAVVLTRAHMQGGGGGTFQENPGEEAASWGNKSVKSYELSSTYSKLGFP